jgi:hypothetical protein
MADTDAAAVAGQQRQPELCIHVLFVVIKVLRVPPSNPLTWQLALTGAGRGGCQILPRHALRNG